MSLKERIEAAISENADRFDNPEFTRLRNFYEEMKSRRAVLKRTYDLPARDAFGPAAYERPADVSRQPSRDIH